MSHSSLWSSLEVGQFHGLQMGHFGLFCKILITDQEAASGGQEELSYEMGLEELWRSSQKA